EFPFGLAVVGCALSIILKLLAKELPAYRTLLDNSSTTLVLGLVFAMSLYITVKMVQGARAEIAAKKK
ncbi:MAG: sulfite exporter TauE/SafE family protein, partial [Desulfamplus sp.]|nr:sulfite exporter TauE/SafE family protein [Desulfamplus sp.]